MCFLIIYLFYFIYLFIIFSFCYAKIVWATKAKILVLRFFSYSSRGVGEDTENEVVNCLIIFPQVNTTVLIQVMREITKKVTRKVENKTQSVKLRAGVRASAALLPLLGITWLFGLLGFSYDTIVFKYIFAIFNSLQGLMVFIFHCALNDKVGNWGLRLSLPP